MGNRDKPKGDVKKPKKKDPRTSKPLVGAAVEVTPMPRLVGKKKRADRAAEMD